MTEINHAADDVEETWEERFEAESPLAFQGREWAKDFIREMRAEAKQEGRAEAIQSAINRVGELPSTMAATDVFIAVGDILMSELKG